MSNRILLKVRPGAVTHKRKAKILAKTYELPHDKFISVEVGERQMLFELYLPAFQGRVSLTTEATALKPVRGLQYAPPNRVRGQFAWDKDPTEIESQRVRPLTIVLEANDGRVANHTLQLQVIPEPLDSLPKLLLNDLTYELHLDWQQTRSDSLRSITEHTDRPRFNSWTTLETELQGVLVAMAQIGQRPFQQLKSGYQFQPFRHHQRLDPHTYRWLARRGLKPHEAQLDEHRLPVPYSQPTEDCPENRFVYGVLQLAIQMLKALEAIFAGEHQWLEEQLFLAQARNSTSNQKKHQEQTQELQKKLADLKHKQRWREQLLHRCHITKQSPFYQQWHNQKTNELTQPPIYSLVLAQNQAYRQIFDFYTMLMASNRADGLVRTNGFVQSLKQAGQVNRAAIYETWSFIRLYRDLRLLGFVPKSGRDLENMIEGSRLTPTLYSGHEQWLELKKDLPNNETVTLRLFHEKAYFGSPPLPKSEEWAWRPDVTLEVWYQQRPYLFFLDTKFIDFAQEDGDSLHKRLFTQSSTYGPAGGIEKYLHIPNACGSFILHPATHPDFENYGATIPNNKVTFESFQLNHPAQYRLGYLPFRPQQTTAFRKWLGLIFILHLQQHQYCWNCHQTNVSPPPKQHCPDCRTSWQLVRCKNCNLGLIFSGEEAPFNWSTRAHRPLCPNCGKEA
jgi:hypothetical protein